MAQIPYRANLSAASFPLTIAKGGRSVIMPGVDQNFNRQVDSPDDSDRSVGIPQALYMENVLPTPDGFQSISYAARGSIENITTSNLLKAIISSRVAKTDTETFASSLIDAGDEIENWTVSPLATGSGLYTEVVESSTVGNPLNSYEMREDETRDNGEQPFMYREVDVTDSTNIHYETQFMFSSNDVTQTKIAMVGVAATASSGANGFKVLIQGGTGNALTIGTTTGWETFTFAALAADALPTLDFDEWYRIEVDITINTDTTKTVVATVYDTDGTTVLATVEYTGSGSVGNFFGMVYAETTHDSPVAYASMYWDNIEVTGDGIGFESELETIAISFDNANHVTWNYSGNTWANLQADTLPVGFVSPLTQDDISYGLVRGNLYVCIRRTDTLTTKIYLVQVQTGTPDTLLFTDVSTAISGSLPSPFTIDDVTCIVSSYNYLLLGTKSTIFWSSTTTPTDFAQSLVSGSGFESPGNLKANITSLKEHSAGFFIHTSKNVVFSAYTGNARYPWKFREIPGSGGFSTARQSSGDTNTSVHVGVTNTGQLQALAPDGAENIAPEATDFLERSPTFDELNYSTGVFTLRTDPLRGANGEFEVYYWLDRYVIVPFGYYLVTGGGVAHYQYHIVYDRQLKRYGKLRIQSNLFFSDDERMHFVDSRNGAISSLTLTVGLDSASGDTHSGFLLLGKFQHLRDRWITLEEIDIECALGVNNSVFSCLLIPTYDGKTFGTIITPTTKVDSGTLVRYVTHKTAYNWSVALKGRFDVNTLQLKYQVHGRR